MSELRNTNAPHRSPSRRRRTHGCVLAFAAALGLTALPCAALAASPSSGLEAFGAPVADDVLADMRGKFVGPTGVAYFGVELQSSWTNAQGVTVAGILAFSLDLRGSSGSGQNTVPILLVGWTRDCEGCAPGTAITTSGNESPTLTTAGLGTVHGAVQSQQIQGSDNVVRNTLRIEVTSADDVRTSQYAGLTPATSSSTQTLPDGGAVHFLISGRQLGLALENGTGAGVVGQSVDSGLNQVSQNVMLTSNLNTVQNSVALTVGIDQMRQADQFNIQNAISAMKGLGY